MLYTRYACLYDCEGELLTTSNRKKQGKSDCLPRTELVLDTRTSLGQHNNIMPDETKYTGTVSPQEGNSGGNSSGTQGQQEQGGGNGDGGAAPAKSKTTLVGSNNSLVEAIRGGFCGILYGLTSPLVGHPIDTVKTKVSPQNVYERVSGTT